MSDDENFKLGPGKFIFRPIISQDETMTIYGKEQEFGEIEEMTMISDENKEKNTNEN